MNTVEIETLRDRAARLYASGQYQEAKDAWDAILVVQPADPHAVEGLRMIETLAGRSGLDGSLESEIVAIEEMLLHGREAEGVQAAEVLALAHPDSAEVGWLASSARARFEAGPFVDEALASARRAWRRGDLPAARIACARILAVDPDHCAAREVLMHADHGAPPDEAMPVPYDPSRTAREEAIPHSGLRAAAESASESLFDLEDSLDQDDVIPLASSPSEGAAAGAAAVAGEESFTEASFADAFEPDEPEKGKFADLEEEILETLSSFDEGGRAAAEDAAFPAEPVNDRADAPGADLQHTLSDDLAFGDAGWSLEETPAEEALPTPAPAHVSPPGAVDPKVAELLREARAAIDAGRYSEAIETASRAFAVDAEAPGAQDVIDQARARLDEVDRQSEEHLYHAHKFLEEGDDTAAEALLREVLRTHPGHREATDLMARISEQKIGADIPTVPLARPAPEPPRNAASTGATEAPLALRTDDRLPASGPPATRDELADGSAIPAIERTQATSVRSGPSVYRFVFYAILVLMLLGVAALGLRFLPKFFIGSETPAPAPVSRRPARPEAVTPAPPTPAPVDARATGDPTAGLPRTLDQARALVGEGKLKEARSVLADIVRLDPGNRQALDLQRSLIARIQEREQIDQAMGSIRAAFSQDRYEDSLRMLYRLPQELQKGDVEIYKRNCWYNNGILFMLGGNSVDAVRCFREALDLDGGDEGAKRQIEYLQSYEGREKDGAYFRHVETLPRRTIDER